MISHIILHMYIYSRSVFEFIIQVLTFVYNAHAHLVSVRHCLAAHAQYFSKINHVFSCIRVRVQLSFYTVYIAESESGM